MLLLYMYHYILFRFHIVSLLFGTLSLTPYPLHTHKLSLNPPSLSLSHTLSLSFSQYHSLRSGQNGTQRLLEGKNINQSLHALNNVFLSLSDPRTSYVNYRGSRLTQCLQVSLNGNSNISIICCITPSRL